MNLKNIILISFLTLTTVYSYGQIEQDSIVSIKEVGKEVKKKSAIKQLEVPIYKLFPTENTWALIKLNTRNGKIWQVHYSISNDFEGELPINRYSLVSTEEEVNGRFTLYPTPNMYNFILLDQIDGSTWKVQWHNERDKRFMRPID
tara:strand:+ start:14 stop:451 length:438 start_codon:yes stop_codon:yes gene_type:complete